MLTLSVYPKNKEKYLKLISFGEECLGICRAHKIEPIVHGSLGYLFYTKDGSIDINDIDFLVFESTFDVLAAEFSKRNLKYEINPYKVKVLNNGSRITFHALEHYLSDLSQTAYPVDIEGAVFEILNLKSLIKSYQIGIGAAPGKAEDYSRKLAVLTEVKI